MAPVRRTPSANSPADAASPAVAAPGAAPVAVRAPSSAATASLVRDLTLPMSYAAAPLMVCLLLVTGNHGHLWFALSAFGVLAVAAGTRCGLWRAPVIGGICWLFLDGFVVHHGGDLGWSHPERLGLAVLPAAAVASAALTAAARVVRERSARASRQ
jgi:hypothetical protein